MARFVLLLLLWGTAPAMALGTLDPAIASDGLLSLIRNSANNWSSVLRGFATDIFGILAVIQFVWTFGQLALKKADLTEMVAELVRFVMITGFYAALLLYSVTWAQAIIDSFRQAAASAAGVSVQLQPGDMFGIAIELGRTIGGIGLVDPVTAFIVSLSAILVVMCFTFIAAFLMVTLIESYVVINAGVFFMAFGGSQWTREYALAMLRYAVSVGAKLFVLTLIVGLIMTSARSWQAAYNQDETSMLTMVGLSLVCAYLSKTLPDMIQALVNGVSSGGGSQIGGMVAAGMAGMAAGAAAMSAATGGGGILGNAGKSVADLIKGSFTGSGGPGGSGGGGASYMNSMGSGPGGGSGSSGSSTGPSPRTGGGGYSQAPGTPPSAGPSSTGQSSSGGQSSSSSVSGSSQAASSGSGSAGSASSNSEKLHAAAHGVTEAAVRTVGLMGSLTVPGMEGAAGTSIGPAPMPPDVPDLSGAAEETPGNIIRPDSPSAMMSGEAGNGPVAGNAPVNSPADSAHATAEGAPTPAVDTMSKLQQALNNQGKIT